MRAPRTHAPAGNFDWKRKSLLPRTSTLCLRSSALNYASPPHLIVIPNDKPSLFYFLRVVYVAPMDNIVMADMPDPNASPERYLSLPMLCGGVYPWCNKRLVQTTIFAVFAQFVGPLYTQRLCTYSVVEPYPTPPPLV